MNAFVVAADRCRRRDRAGSSCIDPRRSAVRDGRPLPPWPGDRPPQAGAAADRPGHRPAAPRVAAHRHDADPVAGHHHARQRQHRRVSRRLLQGRRRGQVGRCDRERRRRDQSDRADDAAKGGRPAHARRDARRDRPHQPEHSRDPRRHHVGLGSGGHAGGAEGHPAAGQHEEGDGPSGGGGARKTRQDHRRRGRGTGRGQARGRSRHHDGPPGGAPVAQPPEPGGDRRRQEHHRGVSRRRS